MVDESITAFIETHREGTFGWKLSGAGSGGYLILISDKSVINAFRVNIRHDLE